MFSVFSDKEIGRIYEACQANGYVLLVTADHGNAEKMIDEHGGKFTAHTCYKGLMFCEILSVGFNREVFEL